MWRWIAILVLFGLCLLVQIGAEQLVGVNNDGSVEQTDTSNSFGQSGTEIRRLPRNIFRGRPVPRFKFGNRDIRLHTKKPINSDGVDLLSNKTEKLPLDLIWHVGVYAKYQTPYLQICGGTLVTTTAVISAAHCFWGEPKGVLPAAHFAVAAAKNYRSWNDPQDSSSQKSDVKAIHVPVRYRGAAASFQEDIAVLLLATEMKTTFAVKPACVHFREEFDDEQLRHGNLGTILGWGLTEKDERPSPVLNYAELPAVGIRECLDRADPGFIRFITSDKFCAGGSTGKAVCRGDSGEGLIFFDDVGSMRVPYLRGVASTAPRNEHACNAQAPSAFTHVRAHRAFLRKHIPDLEAECKKHFKVSEALQDKTGPIQPAVCICFHNKDPAPSQEGSIVFRD